MSYGKVYLLLRNNCETGPYTFEELSQQQLLPTDLIWVEGKSTAWIRPSELKDETFCTIDSTAGKVEKGEHIPVAKQSLEAQALYQTRRSPEAELEAKAIALRKRAEAAAVQHRFQPTSPIKPAVAHRAIYQEEESSILLEIHTINKKNVTLPQLIAAGVITSLLATGWYNREKLTVVRPQASIISQAAAPVLFQVTLPTPKAVVIPATDTVVTTKPEQIVPTASNSIATRVKQGSPVTKKEIKEVNTTPIAEMVISKEVGEKKEEATVTTNSAPVLEKKEEASVDKESVITNEAVKTSPVKKKGLGQALKNIFKKKKKGEEDAVTEQ